MSTRPLVRLSMVAAALLLASCDSLTGPGSGYGPKFSASPLPVSGQHTFVSLSLGDQHTCGLTAGGAAYCWGDNGVGQLGNGAGGEFLDHSPAPVRVSGNHVFVSITTGEAHTCGLTTDGAVYCWGGLGPHCSAECKTTPALLADAPPFVSVEAGGGAICGLTASGDVYCKRPWLGDGGLSPLSLPPLASISLGGDLGSGNAYGCGLTREGEAHCWSDPAGPVAGGYRFASLSAGGGYACGIAEGTVYCWGDNRVGQLGRGFWYNWYTDFPSEPRDFSTPEPVVGGKAFSSITAGAGHTCALTPEGVAYCWGADGPRPTPDGRLGHGGAGACNISSWNGSTYSEFCSATPTQVAGSLTFASLSAGGTHTCALNATGVAYCWGRNTLGQLGMGQSPCKRHRNGSVECG